MTPVEIIDKYPKIFGNRPFDPMKTLICFGFEVGKGWIPVLEDGFKKINDIVEKESIDDFRVTQVKEKFGTLRVYTNWSTDPIDKIVQEMEKTCETVCEECGEPGKFYTDGWMRVRCETCEEKGGY